MDYGIVCLYCRDPGIANATSFQCNQPKSKPIFLGRSRAAFSLSRLGGHHCREQHIKPKCRKVRGFQPRIELVQSVGSHPATIPPPQKAKRHQPTKHSPVSTLASTLPLSAKAVLLHQYSKSKPLLLYFICWRCPVTPFLLSLEVKFT